MIANMNPPRIGRNLNSLCVVGRAKEVESFVLKRAITPDVVELLSRRRNAITRADKVEFTLGTLCVLPRSKHARDEG